MRTSCVKLVAETTVPAVNGPMVKLQPEAPADTSMTTVVPSDFRIRAHVGVIVAAAVPDVMVLAVNRPETALGKAAAPNVSVTPRTLLETAVSAVAGCVPS